MSLKPASYKTFRRGPVATIIGLLHILAGFLSTAGAVLTMVLVGFDHFSRFDSFYVFFIFAYEANSIVLWISGIGILRSARWGTIVGLLWCALAWIFHIGSWIIRKKFWVGLQPGFDWSDYFVLTYAFIFSMATLVVPLIRKNLNWNFSFNFDFSSIRQVFDNISLRRDR